MSENHNYTCDNCNKETRSTCDNFFGRDNLPPKWRTLTIKKPPPSKKSDPKDVFANRYGKTRGWDFCSEKCLKTFMREYVA